MAGFYSILLENAIEERLSKSALAVDEQSYWKCLTYSSYNYLDLHFQRQKPTKNSE